MESLSKSLLLSREEDIKLDRSNKKVKDVHHAISISTMGRGHPQRAYNQAFEVNGQMEEDEDSDDNVDELREGVATMTLSKDAKQRNRAP
nr:hypothetical protein CFP56_33035 [Quercus suber]